VDFINKDFKKSKPMTKAEYSSYLDNFQSPQYSAQQKEAWKRNFEGLLFLNPKKQNEANETKDAQRRLTFIINVADNLCNDIARHLNNSDRRLNAVILHSSLTKKIYQNLVCLDNNKISIEDLIFDLLKDFKPGKLKENLALNPYIASKRVAIKEELKSKILNLTICEYEDFILTILPLVVDIRMQGENFEFLSIITEKNFSLPTDKESEGTTSLSNLLEYIVTLESLSLLNNFLNDTLVILSYIWDDSIKKIDIFSPNLSIERWFLDEDDDNNEF
jgi:hypothetical protein